MAKAKKKAKRRRKKTARKASRPKKRKPKRRSLAISKAKSKKSSPVKSAQKEKPHIFGEGRQVLPEHFRRKTSSFSRKVLAQRRAAKYSRKKRAVPKSKPSQAEEESEAGEEVTLDKTPMRIYLTQIEKIPLLTPEEEVKLAKKIQAEDPGESREAREKMIRSNLRLVISIAKRYANLGLPFSDLVEEGNIGLMRAVDKFNYRKGYRFSTYASWWIKQAIMRALSNQGKTIRVPVYMFDTLSKWRKIRDGLAQKLSRHPTAKEIANVMGIPVEKVKELERITSQPGSLNAPVSLDGSAEMMDLIEDDQAASPIQMVEDLFEGQRIEQLLTYVDERERQVLTLRFGLKGNEPHTLEEAAKKFNVTRERIRQIELAAIKKIRLMLKTKEEKLEDYVG